MNKGWVKLWRVQFDHFISDRKPWCDGYAWCYLYSRANHKKGFVNFRNEYIEIDRGQFLTSKIQLQELFGWTRRHCDNFLLALENDKMLTYRITNRYIIITIINYDTYQSTEINNDIQNDIQVSINKNDKNLKNDKNVEKDNKELTLFSSFEMIEKDFTEEELKLKEDFFEYWTEKNPNGKKERWQMEKVFDVKKRFRTFIKNNEKWNKGKIIPKHTPTNKPADLDKLIKGEEAKREQGITN